MSDGLKHVSLEEMYKHATTIAFDPNAKYLILFDPDFVNRMAAERILVKLREMGIQFTMAMVKQPHVAARMIEFGEEGYRN